ncbi:MAG: glycosyltransferase family 4 protein [Phaeodactylibacter sp.]|nr:glycosyltransferase family 4 protein [Phaeodactylibacter sp.]
MQQQYGVELLVIHWPGAKEAPFGEALFSHIDHRHNKEGLSVGQMVDLLRDFAPQALLISGWMDKDYLKVARQMRKEGLPVIAGCDTQWTGSLRQKAGQIIAPWYLHPAIDVLWVSGERQQQLARRLGYRGQKCWTGYYACDWERFRTPAPRSFEKAAKAFFYVGRYIPRKGIEVLAEAYRSYRSQSNAPWELWTAGAGPEAARLNEIAGGKNLGFLQPDELPALLREVGAFILPSRVEPWGVVLQEAAAAGLPLLCSDASGAAVHLLTDGFNGFSFENGNAAQLAQRMLAIASLPAQQWEAMSRGSFELSKQYTPEIWARTLVEGIAIFKQ